MTPFYRVHFHRLALLMLLPSTLETACLFAQHAASDGSTNTADGGINDTQSTRPDRSGLDLEHDSSPNADASFVDTVLVDDVTRPDIAFDAGPYPDLSTSGDALMADREISDQALHDQVANDAHLNDVNLVDVRPDDTNLHDTSPGDTLRRDATLPAVDIVANGRFSRLLALHYDGLLDRDVVVYVPVDYEEDNSRHYPVIYMHDGQNLFDAQRASFGVEWQVDETIDQLTQSGELDAHIVVGIDNTSERIEDYTATVDSNFGGGKGAHYADFIVELVKPLIDAHFRTRPERESTSLMGSSLGGLISLYIAQRHATVFANVAAVSPSLWWNNRAPLIEFENYTGLLPQRLWIDTGTHEDFPSDEASLYEVEDTRRLVRAATDKGLQEGVELAYFEVPFARHNEAAWARRLDAILVFLCSQQRPLQRPLSAVQMVPWTARLALTPRPGITQTSLIAYRGEHFRYSPPHAAAALTSLQPEVCDVDGTGQVTAHARGEAQLRVQLESNQALSPLWVGDDFVVQRFVVDVPATTPNDASVYLCGDIEALDAWNPAGTLMHQLEPLRYFVDVKMPSNTNFAYKFTRGTWDSVEKDAWGDEVLNHTATASDGLREDVVQKWADL